jgi:hypothetical protein
VTKTWPAAAGHDQRELLGQLRRAEGALEWLDVNRQGSRTVFFQDRRIQLDLARGCLEPLLLVLLELQGSIETFSRLEFGKSQTGRPEEIIVKDSSSFQNFFPTLNGRPVH